MAFVWYVNSPFVDVTQYLYELHVAGIMPALLQEIVSVYPQLSPPNLTAHISNRVCNALALLQCVASHPETRQLFLNGTSPCPVVYAINALRICSSYTTVLIPFPEYYFQNTSF